MARRQALSRGLVAIDLDGTLIGESLTIADQDSSAIRAAVRSGYHVSLASGRLFAASRPFAEALGLTDPVIGLQGAVAYEMSSGRRLFCTTVPIETALVAYDYLKARAFHLQLYYGDQLYLDTLNEAARYYLQLSRVEPVMVADLRELLTTAPPSEPGPIKLLAVAAPDVVSGTIPQLAAHLGSKANVFRSLPRFLEVTHPNANKGYALQQVAALLGVDMQDTAAIGDSDNDVPMFRVAARSFAVANGTATAKQAAGQVVAACGGGVAQALHLLIQERTREPA